MDAALNYIPGILIRTADKYSAFCGHISYLTYGGYSFAPAPEIDYSKIAPVTAALDNSSSCRITNIPAGAGSLIGDIYDRVPYSKVEVVIYAFEVNSSFAVTAAHMIYRGLLYRAQSSMLARYANLEAREDKYYFDKTAGVVCTEQCGAAYFGDKVCGKAITTVSKVVDSISGSSLTLTSAPAGANYLYCNGYVEYDGVRIKISYWQSGAVLNLISPAPASWDGKTISVVAGCDRTLSTCKNVHNNEANYFGCGYSMVDYNAVVEEV